MKHVNGGMIHNKMHLEKRQGELPFHADFKLKKENVF